MRHLDPSGRRPLRLERSQTLRPLGLTAAVPLLLLTVGCAHLPIPRAPEELDHAGRLAASVNATVLPGFKDPVVTLEGHGHTDFEGGEPYAGGLLLSVAPSGPRSVVSDIPFAVDPRIFVRAQECLTFLCGAVEVGGMPHVFGIPVLGLWYGAEANAGLLVTIGRSGHVGGHLRFDILGGADRVTWLEDSWTAFTFNPTAGAGITGRAGGIVFGAEASVTRYLASRAHGDLTSHTAENLLLLSVSIGLDEEVSLGGGED